MVPLIVAGAQSFALALLLTPLLIRLLRRRGIGQPIHDEVQHHTQKAGTPRMSHSGVRPAPRFPSLIASRPWPASGRPALLDLGRPRTARVPRRRPMLRHETAGGSSERARRTGRRRRRVRPRRSRGGARNDLRCDQREIGRSGRRPSSPECVCQREQAPCLGDPAGSPRDLERGHGRRSRRSASRAARPCARPSRTTGVALVR